jgi:uncharacterized OB-fold protein
VGKNTIYTYTVIYSAAEAFKDMTPYVVALVDDGEKLVMSRIEGYDESKHIKIGDSVQLIRLDDNGKPIYKFIN